MDKRRACRGHICKVVMCLENGLGDGKFTIVPLMIEAPQMGSSKISKVSFILSPIIIIRAAWTEGNHLDIIRSDGVHCNIIIVPSRRMLLLPPNKNIGRATFEKQEAEAFIAPPMTP